MTDLEQQFNSGLIEEVVQVAHGEMELVDRMGEAKV